MTWTGSLIPLVVAFIIAILFVLFAFYLLRNTVNLVQQGFVGVTTRLGEFRAIHEPGLAIIAPFIDKLVSVDMREYPRPGDRQEVITKDNVVVSVNATIFTQVVDAKQALFSIANFDVAIDALARTALRSVIGTLSLDEALSERERINVDVQEQMEAVTDKWGIRINRIEIVEITPPPQILQALALQKQADQEKRAKILQSEGLQQSAVNVADGERQAAIKSAEGERQAAILIAEGNRQAAILEAEGRARAIETVYSAITAPEPEPDPGRHPPARHAEQVRVEPEHEDRDPGRIVGTARRGPGDPVGARAGPGGGIAVRPGASSARRPAPPARSVPAPGGGPPWRGCRRSPCRTSGGGWSVRRRRRSSRRSRSRRS